MIGPIFYYLILPFMIGGWLIKQIKKRAPSLIPPDVQALVRERPIERKWYRAVRRGAEGLSVLGDFEKQPEAVESAYRGKEEAARSGERAAFLVLNDQGEVLEEVGS